MAKGVTVHVGQVGIDFRFAHIGWMPLLWKNMKRLTQWQ
jgi:hypothetical protein